MSGGTASAIVGVQREIIVRGRQEQAPATVEAYGVDSTFVLLQPPLLDAQRVHKVLGGPDGAGEAPGRRRQSSRARSPTTRSRSAASPPPSSGSIPSSSRAPPPLSVLPLGGSYLTLACMFEP